MRSTTSKTILMLALILLCFAIISSACCKKPRVVTVIRVPTSCLETIGDKPEMTMAPNLEPEGCPEEMACLDATGMRALSRWIGATLRWMEQAQIACSEEKTDE